MFPKEISSKNRLVSIWEDFRNYVKAILKPFLQYPQELARHRFLKICDDTVQVSQKKCAYI